MSTSKPTAVPALDLDAYRWHNRLLFIFTPSPHDWNCRQQHSFLGQSHDLVDRQILVATIYENEPGQISERTISHAESEALRTQFVVAPEDFAVILIGKDGHEKRRFDQPVAPQELFAIIDSMPMRQEELERGK